MSSHQSSRFLQLATEARERITEILPTQAAAHQQQGAVVLDVREASEFTQGHIQGAIHLSRGIVELQIEQVIPDPATPIVCYCGGGNRAALVVDNLQKMGYTNVVSLAGGFHAWSEAALPIHSVED